jgi:hypothetical protein
MKRVLSLATTGLFLTGLALVPMSVRADPAAVVDGKTIMPTQTDSTTAPKITHSGTVMPQTDSTTAPKMTPSGHAATAPVIAPVKKDEVKKDDKNLTATPNSSAPASGVTTTKTPAKGAS